MILYIHLTEGWNWKTSNETDKDWNPMQWSDMKWLIYNYVQWPIATEILLWITYLRSSEWYLYVHMQTAYKVPTISAILNTSDKVRVVSTTVTLIDLMAQIPGHIYYYTYIIYPLHSMCPHTGYILTPFNDICWRKKLSTPHTSPYPSSSSLKFSVRCTTYNKVILVQTHHQLHQWLQGEGPPKLT